MSREAAATLLADAAQAGVYRLPPRGRNELRAAAGELGHDWARISLEGVKDKAGFLSAVSQGLTFPDWFGHNWDALEDCLTDLSWRPAAGYFIVLSHADGFRSAAREDFDTALSIFAAAADFWREDGVAFWTLVDLDDGEPAELPELPLTP